MGEGEGLCRGIAQDEIGLYHVYHQQLPLGRHRETHILVHKRHAIHLLGVVLIMWARVECQHFAKRFEVVGREYGAETFGYAHI